MSVPFEKELATYYQKLPELLQHSGKYVMIKDAAIVGVFDSYRDAITAGYSKFKMDPFLVKQITPASEIYNFTRDLETACL